jgi:oligopeptide/dipeptide ABC transporter ATP-binding protein
MAAVPSANHRRGKLAAIDGTVPELVDPPPSCHFHTRCPYAVELCRTADPEPIPVGDSHTVACFAFETIETGAILPTLDW